MAGYLILVTGTLFVDGARTVIQNEENRQKVVVAGMCFWIGAAFGPVRPVRAAAQRGWDTEMKNRLSAVAEETLLTLAPLDLSLDVEEKEEDGDERRLVVVASSDGPVADLEFIGGGDSENIEDRVRQLQQHDVETTAENELSLQLLRSYASSVRHQQYHDTDIITVRVAPPERDRQSRPTRHPRTPFLDRVPSST